MDKQLLMQMEHLRSKMVETAEVQQNLQHRDVIMLSQSLDELIVKVQKGRLALSRSH